MSLSNTSLGAHLLLSSLALFVAGTSGDSVVSNLAGAQPVVATVAGNASAAAPARRGTFEVADPAIDRLDAGSSWSTYSFGRSAVIVLEHRVGAGSPAARSTSASLSPRVRLASGVDASAVRVRTTYSVAPRGSIGGSAMLGARTLSLRGPEVVSEEREVAVASGEWIEVGDVTGRLDVASGGAWARTTMVLSLEEDDEEGDEELETDDELDDEAADDPCDEGDKIGDGLWLEPATGKVSATLAILETRALDDVELDFELAYESTRAHRATVVGYGWSHSYGQRITVHGPHAVYYDSTGRRNAFRWQGSGYGQPMGRDLTLQWITDHFEVRRSDGSREVFRPGTHQISSIVDRRGRTTRFHYDDLDRLSTIVSPHGRTVTLEHDASGRVHKVTDPSGETTTFEYDSSGNLWRVTDPTGAYTEYKYDALSRLTDERLRNGASYFAAYSSSGSTDTHELFDGNGATIVRAVSAQGFAQTEYDFVYPDNVAVTDGRGLAWTYSRDNLGRLRTITTPNGKQRIRTYGGPTSGANRNRLVALTDENNRTRTVSWNVYGRIVQATDAAGHVEQYGYAHPTIPGLMTSLTEPDGDVWTYVHHPVNGDLWAAIDPLNDAPTYGSDRYMQLAYVDWDPMAGVPSGGDPLPGRLQTVYRADENWSIERTDYDTSGNMISVVRGFAALNLQTTFAYDASGRCTLQRQNRGDRWVETSYSYDQLGRKLTEVVDPTGLALSTALTYDEVGNLLTSTDPRGVVTAYGYDHRNRLSSRVEDSANLAYATTWEFDGNSNLLVENLPNGDQVQFAYNEQNYLVQTLDAEGFGELLTRDGVGNVTRYRRSLAPGTAGPYYEIAAEWDEINRQTARVVAPATLNQRTEFFYEAPSGCGCGGPTPNGSLVQKVVDPAGKHTYFTYDDRDRLKSRIDKIGDVAPAPDGDDAVRTWQYDAGGNLLATVGAEGERLEFTYDAVNRRASVVAKDADQGDVSMAYAYDGCDNVSTVTLPNGHAAEFDYDGANRMTNASDDIGVAASFAYDATGNLLSRSTAIAGQTVLREYDALGRLVKLIDPINGPTAALRYAYDERGNMVERIDNKNIRTTYAYDAIDRLTAVTRHATGSSSSTANTTTSYAWDGMSVTALVDHDGNTTTFEYDEALRLVQELNPIANGTGVGVTTWAYDVAGNVATRTDSRGIVTTYGYDDLHRRVSRSYSTGTVHQYTYDRSGRIQTATDGTIQSTMTYDLVGRPESHTTTFGAGGTSYTVSRRYTAAVGDIHSSIESPTGRKVFYTYDERLQLAQVDGGAGIGASYGYDAAGRRSTETLANDVDTLLSWDLDNRLTRITHAKDATTLFDVQLGYDPNGNRKWSQDNVRTQRSELVAYDELDRVRKVDRGVIDAAHTAIVSPLVDASVPSTEEWETLDRRSNWSSLKTRISGGAAIQQTRSANAANEYLTIDPDGSGPVAPSTLVYDANGNVIEDPLARNAGDGATATGQLYEYDEENRLVEVRRRSDHALLLEIRYDALGARVETIDHLGLSSPCGGSAVRTRHVRGGSTPVAEYASCNGGATWSLAREWVVGETQRDPIAMIDWTSFGSSGAGKAEVLHHLRDALGNVVALTNANGAIVERYDYTAYGQTYVSRANGTRIAASEYGNVFGYTGHRYDAGVGLYHTAYRTLSPRLGRWLQRDPAGFVDGVNRFEYAVSSPLNWIDPLGLCIGGCAGGGGGGGGQGGGQGGGGQGGGGQGGGGQGGGGQGGGGQGGGGGYSVTIHADQPGTGGDRDPYEQGSGGVDVGHTFVTLTNHNTGETTTAGFYPSDPVSPFDPSSPGEVNNDAGHGSDVSRTYPITEEEYNKAKDKIERDRKKPPEYNLNKHNCTDWALDVLREAGECPPDTEGKWPFGKGSNPGDLGEDLRKENGGNASGTAPGQSGGGQQGGGQQGGGQQGGGQQGGGQQGGGQQGGGQQGGGGKKSGNDCPPPSGGGKKG